MNDQHDFTAGLPARRDDEPPSLRQDIVDELADHLTCAARREQLLEQPAPGAVDLPQSAQARAIQQFGNPAQVARRLWWDAMQEKIMTQRLSTVMLGVVAAAALGMSVVTWRTVADLRLFLDETQKLNVQLVQKLVDLQHDSAPPNYDWCGLTVKLVRDAPNGPPAAGLSAVLQKLESGNSQTDTGKIYPSTELQSDAAGLIDFSPVPYGSYYLSVQTEAGHLLKKEFVVRPGNDAALTIVCPNNPPTGEVALEVSRDGVTLPEDIADRVWVLCNIYQPSFQSWGLAAGSAFDSPYGGTRLGDDRWLLWINRSLLISPSGETLAIDPWPIESVAGTEGANPFGGAAEPFGSAPTQALVERLTLESAPRPIERLPLPMGEYTVDFELVVLEPDQADGELRSWRRLTTEEKDQIVAEAAPYESTPLKVAADELSEWKFGLNSLPGTAWDQSITIAGRPQTIFVSGGSGGFGGGFGGNGFAGGGGGGFF